MHGVLVNGTTGEWFSQSTEERRLVAETAIDAVGGRMPVLIGCTDYTADLVIAARAGTRSTPARPASRSTPPPYAKPFDDEIVAFYEDIAAGVPDVPLMIYNWSHGTSVDIGTALAERLVEIDTVVAIKDSTPNVEQFYATLARGQRPGARVRPVHVASRATSSCKTHGGDGDDRRRLAVGPPGPGVLGGALARRRGRRRWRTRGAPSELFPKLWLPGGWAGQYGALPEPAEGADDSCSASRAGPSGGRGCRSPIPPRWRRCRRSSPRPGCSCAA